MKLNVDGSLRKESKLAGVGGVMRDAAGGWVVGFTARIVGCPIEEVGTWALLNGLMVAWNHGARKIIVETDSLQVFKWVKGMEVVINFHANVVYECQTWLQHDWAVTV